VTKVHERQFHLTKRKFGNVYREATNLC